MKALTRQLRTRFSSEIVSFFLVWIIIIFITLHNFATKTEIRSRTTSYQFYKHRIRLWNEGRGVLIHQMVKDWKCTSVTLMWSKLLAWIVISDHKLIYERTGGCVGYSKSEERSITNESLHLQECDASESVGHFDLINGSYIMVRPLQNSHLESGPHFITPLFDIDQKLWKLNYQKVCINGTVGLTNFDQKRSRVILSEESFFQKDRKILKTAVIPPSDDSCDFKACGFNRRISPIKKLPTDQVQRCKKPWECVTLVVKTARRPHLVARLAQSVRDKYRYHRSLEGGTKYCTRVRVQYFISPRGRQPEAEIFSYSTEGPTGPSAIRLFRPRGEDDIVYIHERALLKCSCNATN